VHPGLFTSSVEETRLQKNPGISLSFPAFGARTRHVRSPAPWRLAADGRAAMRPLTFRKQGLKQMATVKELKATRVRQAARGPHGQSVAPAECPGDLWQPRAP